ncbi:iron-sulfur cluster-binding domain-containing protein [Niastella caeni]|uniref:Iron-sulfur cluster-binding domain-containing protein n=1 Tax=Niastella caeni TaxID=2569763 RepID=A0A4S8HC01_9BACT|nr:iron-sulfur cluster-binding domain-containing protein [Niastella caeni]THU32488.1 iron-sulfur cluster-binding domain-containing protein [Niastella caeni]
MELLQWKVIQVIKETPDTNTYELEEAQGKPVTWDAGQSITFLFYHHGHEIRRSYSICTAPGIDKHIAITVKRKPNGEISRYILNTWQWGTIVSSLPPAGRFTIETNAAKKRHICFIAAGGGIAPILGMIKKTLYHEPESHIILIYQNHDEHSIIYHHTLQQLATQYAHRFKRIDLLSNPIEAELRPARLNNWLLEQFITTNYKQQTTNILFYTCGPDPFMRMVQFTLRTLGFSEDQLRKEHFVIEPVRKPAFTMPSTAYKVVLHYAQKTHQLTTAWPDTLLQAAQKQGITLPFSCNTGRCGTCAAHCRKGSVTMSNNEVLTDADLQAGLVLTCTGYATSDVELDV